MMNKIKNLPTEALLLVRILALVAIYFVLQDGRLWVNVIAAFVYVLFALIPPKKDNKVISYIADRILPWGTLLIIYPRGRVDDIQVTVLALVFIVGLFVTLQPILKTKLNVQKFENFFKYSCYIELISISFVVIRALPMPPLHMIPFYYIGHYLLWVSFVFTFLGFFRKENNI